MPITEMRFKAECRFCEPPPPRDQRQSGRWITQPMKTRDLKISSLLKISLPCNWCNFRHRWSWVLQEAPAFLIPFTMLVESWSTLTVAKIILLAAFLVHYFNRLVELPLSSFS